MGLFLSFLGGAAEQFSEDLRKSEEAAKANAMLSVKAMTSNYEQVVKENMSLAKKLKDDEDFILSYHPKATPDQVRELLARPTVMEAFRKYKDPSSINLDSLVKISAGNPSAATAAERIAAFPDMVEKATAVAKTTMPKRVSPLGQIYDEFGEQAFTSAQNKALMQTAQALGISVEDLKSQRRLERPVARGEVDMSVFVEKPEFKDIKDNAQVSLLQALESGDDNKIKTASQTVARIAIVEEQGRTQNKTEPQIQSELISKIQAATDPKEKQLLTNQLRQRQVLAKLPGEGKSDADKISQSNLIVAATKTRDAILADVLPPGSFVVTVDPNSGASTLNIKELQQPELYKKGVEAARSAIIKEYTNPQTGMPRSEMHKNAMMSVGIQFDQTGRPVGGITPPPAPSAGMPTPKTKAEYDAIPSGTQYRDTDGKVKIKR